MSKASLLNEVVVQSETPAILPLVQRWILRILMTLNGHREFLRENDFKSDSLADALGLGNWLDAGSDEYDRKKIKAELVRLHKQAELPQMKSGLPQLLQRNLDELSRLVGLPPVDQQLLGFAVLIYNDDRLDVAADCLGRLSSLEIFRALSVILDQPEHAIRLAFSRNSLLARTGMLQVDGAGIGYLRGKLDFLSYTFADSLYSDDADPILLLKGIVAAASAPTLVLDDYGHISESLALLLPYLQKVAAERPAGANILIYGKPGSGKSQLARVVATHLKQELFEIASGDSDGDSISATQRLRAYRTAQCFFSKRHTMLVFDEAEDVFNDTNDWFGTSTAQSRKAWINRTLESNPVPAFWLSNTVNGIDPATLRRFDMIIELPIPPKPHRQRILANVCGNFSLTDYEISAMADLDDLSPAVAARAASIVDGIRGALPIEQVKPALHRLINSTLKAQGYKPVERMQPQLLPAQYDPALLHCETNLIELADGIRKVGTARLCLYGPPGTGKTAYASWLAQQLRRPLLVKRASDLASKFVGEVEQNIAEAFAQAARDNSVLLIDEIESFLLDRRGAHASWEVSQVNEMLTQMEAFKGVFIAATNLMSLLDQAALRRFDLKLAFDYLLPQQAKLLCRRTCEELGLPEPQEDELAKLQSLANLAVGDFAAVVRRHRFCSLCSVAELVDALSTDCKSKESHKRAIGFL